MGSVEDSLKRLGKAIENKKLKKEERAANYGIKSTDGPSFGIKPLASESEIKTRNTEETLLSILESEGESEYKKSQIIEIALNYPEGEKACRDVYKKGLDCNLKDLQMGMGTMNWCKEFSIQKRKRKDWQKLQGKHVQKLVAG
jgi:hypothetical protein